MHGLLESRSKQSDEALCVKLSIQKLLMVKASTGCGIVRINNDLEIVRLRNVEGLKENRDDLKFEYFRTYNIIGQQSLSTRKPKSEDSPCDEPLASACQWLRYARVWTARRKEESEVIIPPKRAK